MRRAERQLKRARCAGRLIGLATAVVCLTTPLLFAQETALPSPPAGIRAFDHPWDGGLAIDVEFERSPDDAAGRSPAAVREYVIERAAEPDGLFVEAVRVAADTGNRPGPVKATVEVSTQERGESQWFRVAAVGPDGATSAFVRTTEPAAAVRQWFDGSRFWLVALMAVLCGAIVMFIGLARRGAALYVRPIAGLEAVEEAVGRATEMGRPCLFVPGIQDMNEIQTIAGLTILARVAERAAEYDATVEVPTSRSLVMTAARETVEAAYYAAARPDAFNPDRIYYVTDEQFGYVAYLTGHMVREKPAACFYMGSFFAESLMLAETGNSIGAIQVAGTAQPSQLPFFVAACDYTLIGEEFFAASAYLSGDPDQLGSLKGQDVGKVIVGGLLLIGCGLFTLGAFDVIPGMQSAAEYLKGVMLKGS